MTELGARLEACPDPIRVRAAYVADSDIQDMVASAVGLCALDSFDGQEAA